MGHEVTLFASGDSVTSARHVPIAPRALRLDPTCQDQMAWHVLMLDHVLERAAEFDVLHFHIDYLPFPFANRLERPSLTTLHGRLDLPDLLPLFRRFRHLPLVSISDAQREPLPWANWVATVYHGLPEDLYRLNENPRDYLVFVGRIAPEKRVDRAIEIARRTGRKLILAAKVATVDQDYFDSEIRPMLDSAPVEFIGEVNEFEKQDLLGHAAALLFPIDWPEPFGLAMIEAMACGTPVIACRRGSVPEVVDEGVTGYVVDDVDQAIEAVDRVASISRAGCRARFEERFTASRMARDYLGVYSLLAAEPGDRVYSQTGAYATGRSGPSSGTVLHRRNLGSGS
jgi:glycosyltransferase involved in cell wall biosynthesis